MKVRNLINFGHCQIKYNTIELIIREKATFQANRTKNKIKKKIIKVMYRQNIKLTNNGVQ
jgi:hypothetical protein